MNKGNFFTTLKLYLVSRCLAERSDLHWFQSKAIANEATTIGYVEYLDKYPKFDQSSACAKAAQA